MERPQVRQLIEKGGEYLLHADLDIVYREGPAVGYPGRSREGRLEGEVFYSCLQAKVSLGGVSLPKPLQLSNSLRCECEGRT